MRCRGGRGKSGFAARWEHAPADVVRFVIGIAMRPVALGACVGIGGSIGSDADAGIGIV